MAQTTPDEAPSSNLTNPILNYIYIKFEQQTKHSVNADKHKPQAQMLLLNWHIQNPNITAVEMLSLNTLTT